MVRYAELEKLPWFANCEDDQKAVGVGPAGGRKSFSYFRLPDPKIRISVIKLDGSSFAADVGKTADVLHLKVAIENVFCRFSEENGVEISWSHVWGQFCLSYNEHKLVDDKESLRTLGIKDGDKLHFVRHSSFDDSSSKRRSIKHVACHSISFPLPNVIEEIKENNKIREVEHAGWSEDVVLEERKISRLFLGLFCYSKLKRSKKAKSNMESFKDTNTFG